MKYGIAMHVNPLGEDISPRLKLNQEELEVMVDKTKEGVEAADMILRS